MGLYPTIADLITRDANIANGHNLLHDRLAGFQHSIREEYKPEHGTVDLIAFVWYLGKQYYFFIRTDEHTGLPQHHYDWDSAIEDCMIDLKNKLMEMEPWQ